MPRPSSPVHAKASTKCSYLTLENPHHQRQVCIKTWRLEMARRIISARYYICKCRIAAFPWQKPRIDRHAPRHRFKNPFTMSKTRGQSPATRPWITPGRISFFILETYHRRLRATHVARQTWWSQSGSNRRPQACKASALPTELWPRIRQQDWKWWAEEDLNLRPYAYQAYALTT